MHLPWTYGLSLALCFAWAQSVTVRKELRQLEPEERASVFDALWTMKTTSPEAGRERFGPKFRSYDEMTLKHFTAALDERCDQGHFGPAFPVFHRLFLLEFERSLQAVTGNPDLGLPFWDVILDVGADKALNESILWSEDWFGAMAGRPEDDYRVLDGRFASWPIASNLTSELRSPYGYLRAPWDNNPVPSLTRVPVVCSPAGAPVPWNSSNFEAALEQPTFMDWLLTIDTLFTPTGPEGSLEAGVHAIGHGPSCPLALGAHPLMSLSFHIMRSLHLPLTWLLPLPWPSFRALPAVAIGGVFNSKDPLCFLNWAPTQASDWNNPQGWTTDFVRGCIACPQNCTVGLTAPQNCTCWHENISACHYAGDPTQIGSSGDFLSGATSPNEPLFFFYHANVDRSFMTWQRTPAAMALGNYSGFPEEGHCPGHNLRDVLSDKDPFTDLFDDEDRPGPYTAADVLELTAPGVSPYTYEPLLR